MPGGRPRIYKSVAKLEKDCESFFELCAEEGVRPTITGLALHLGFADKTTLYEYRDRPEFSYPIKKSLLLIEKCLELKLENQAVTGIIFALKNKFSVSKSGVITGPGPAGAVKLPGLSAPPWLNNTCHTLQLLPSTFRCTC